MKWSVVRLMCAVFLAGALWKPASGQNYYLVVGAFATESDDIREITSILPGTSSDTSYAVQQDNNLLHFYVMKTSNKELAIAKSMALQGEIQKESNTMSNPKIALPESSHPSGELILPSDLTASAGNSGDRSAAAGGGAPPKPKGQYFKFTITSPDGTIFPAKVHQVDLAQELELDAFNSNTYVQMGAPEEDAPMTFVCGVFGYKEIQKYIDYSDPSKTEGAWLDENGAWVVPYSLERLERGDVSIMYNLSFLENAVIMSPESEKELKELVDMMTSNPAYVIKVHAHCNGRGSRNILAPGRSCDYFSTESVIELEASAKRLTNLRGQAIQSYLVDHGIDKERIKIYGWGGTEMLVEKDSENSRLNDRIEIEILED